MCVFHVFQIVKMVPNCAKHNMKAQSVLYNYTILLNLENERTSIQINFLDLNPFLRNRFGQAPHISPLRKTIKTPNLLKKLFENQK